MSNATNFHKASTLSHVVLACAEWRLQHAETIDNTKQGAKRKAALYGLLEKETQLISMIGRKQTRANEENRRAVIGTFLEKVRTKF